MRTFPLLLLLLCSLLPAAAQQPDDAETKDSQAHSGLAKGAWDLGVFGGFANGLGDRSEHQFLLGGVRVGKVLTAEHGPGWMRGNFEVAADVMPLFIDFAGQEVQLLPQDRTIGGTYYGFSVNPLVLKWNFTGGRPQRKVVPFFEIAGGMLFTNRGFPETATSHFNFTPQFAGGFQVFTREDRAVTVSIRGMHISNASISAPNPGVNAVLAVTVGYHWFK